MAALDLPIAESFFRRYDTELVTAALSLLIAFGLAVAVNRVATHRGRLGVGDLELDPTLDTRLRLVRRMVTAAIIVIGISVAISQFAALDRLATSLLASGALAAAVVGFAARQTLANAVAGVLIAIAQPIRIGDHVTFETETGVVEDITLAYTFLRTPADARMIVPNERLASGVIRNDTIRSRRVGTEVAVWLPADADADRAVGALQGEAGPEATVRVAEVDPDGRVRLTVSGTAGAPEERVAREGDLRAGCLRRLRAEGLLPAPEPPGPGPEGPPRPPEGPGQDPEAAGRNPLTG